MSQMLQDALEFLNEHESDWGVTLNRREYLLGIIESVGFSEQRDGYIRELAALTDEQLKG